MIGITTNLDDGLSSSRDIWGFLLFSHGWTWSFWGVAVLIVGLNAIGGIVFGWLFWRYSLEAAMAAHAAAHVVALSAWFLLLVV